MGLDIKKIFSRGRISCVSIAVLFLLFLFITFLYITEFPSSYASSFECGTWQWPVKKVSVMRKFERPPAKWLAGHRGVDLEASEGLEIYAPNDGVISYKSSVAGKPVVVVTHGSVKSTFEPATTDLPINTTIKKGEKIGVVNYKKDVSKSHCTENGCVHWGIKTGKDEYTDPEMKINCCPIVILE